MNVVGKSLINNKDVKDYNGIIGFVITDVLTNNKVYGLTEVSFDVFKAEYPDIIEHIADEHFISDKVDEFDFKAGAADLEGVIILLVNAIKRDMLPVVDCVSIDGNTSYSVYYTLDIVDKSVIKEDSPLYNKV